MACEIFLQSPHERTNRTWPQRVAGVARWLASLPRPTGIFAVHDYRAQFLMEASHEAGLRIPEDIAVLGMDNDETICEHCAPTLSSVSRSSERVGWEAAALLDRLLCGEPPPDEDLLVEPDQVVMRQSTDNLYSADPLVKSALDYLRTHLETPFNIAQVAETLGVSKRTLETRFRDRLHRSPHQFLSGLRVQHAQALLRTPPRCSL
ncbi:MAG: substrate-binding domain-containing protein [Chthoniobacteraceae bacterium]